MYSDIIDPLKEAKKRNIKVVEFGGEGTLNGMISQIWDRTFISLDGEMNDIKKRIVCFHELWHYDTDTIYTPGTPRMEGIANEQSRILAIPEDKLREAIKDYQDYSCLAAKFWVSPKMIEERCRELGLNNCI